MSTFVLIIVISSTLNGGGNKIVQQEFNTKAKCEAAVKQLVQHMVTGPAGLAIPVAAGCFEK